MGDTHVLPPDPARMIEGLRDTGYEFATAVADIIDNSIAAESTLVDIKIDMDYRGAVQVSIADNGVGMDRNELINAMKYGSQRRDSPASLGKFGLGLKTASTAFCRRLSVLSRSNDDTSALQATWDLDHVISAGEWLLILPEPDKDSLARLEATSSGQAGTVVTWEKIDRLFQREYQKPAGSAARKALDRKVTGLAEHIGMVYQRFLDPSDDRAQNVEIRLNDANVEPWDPYCEGISELVANDTVQVELEGGIESSFTIRAFVLPRREEFPNEDAEKRARITNERQGIYIYRENRLIHDADWLNMFQQEPHSSLLRVEFSFQHDLDDAFNVDIKKSRIMLEEKLWYWLREQFLPAPRRAAQARYRSGQRSNIKGKSTNVHDTSNRNIASKERDIDAADVNVLDAKSGDVEVTNQAGTVRLKLKVSSALKPGQCYIEPADGIDDGLLWEPCIIDGHNAIRINTGHPYYHKVYVPNHTSGVTIQGMDSLLWALCSAEFGTVTENNKTHFLEMRYEVSKLLRRLVADLPEPEFDEDE